VATYSDPSVLTVDTASKKIAGPLLVLLAGITSVGFAIFMYFHLSQVATSLARTKGMINDRTVELANSQGFVQDLTDYQNIDADLHQLFDNQRAWEVVLGRIEPHLYRQMKVTSLQLTDQNNFVFTGVTHSYTDYAKIYASLTSADAKKYFKLVKPSAITKLDSFVTDKNGNKTAVPGQSEVSFSFVITLDPAVTNAHE
jgi:hypothetical protein